MDQKITVKAVMAPIEEYLTVASRSPPVRGHLFASPKLQ